MSASIFLSYNRSDKLFARRLARDLIGQGVQVWLDEAEVQIGDSIIEKIRKGIDSVDYLAVILSPDSVNSSWVQREIDVAMNQEIEGKRVKVLPLLYRKCELPGFLKGKLYADFTEDSKYQESLSLLLKRLAVSLPDLTLAVCHWNKIFKHESCSDLAATGVKFCPVHVDELARRAAGNSEAYLSGRESYFLIRTFIVSILTAASVVGIEQLVKNWDYLWQNIIIGGMFPPGFYWKETPSGDFLGRPSYDGDGLLDYMLKPMDASKIVEVLLKHTNEKDIGKG